ncbi:MAG: S49 family peptidase, partial [Phocaeicola sp.]
TLTGSIGIFGMIPNAQELLKNKIGLHFDAVNTHQFSDMGSMGRSLKPAEREAIQQAISRGYNTFINRCATGRSIDVDSIKMVGEGRIWSGEMAQKLRLVDELGGLERALAIAVERAGISAYTLQTYPEQETLFELLLSSKSNFLAAQLKKSLGSYYTTLQFLEQVSTAEPVQARLPFELIIE